MAKVDEGHESPAGENAGPLTADPSEALVDSAPEATAGDPEGAGEPVSDLGAELVAGLDEITAPGEEATAVAGQSVVGEVLADRYKLEEHINDDPAGRQIWRGTDIVLRRAVAMVLRHPGGDAALEMLSAAVTASRVVHPNLAGVYDAVDEGDRAYVVREWVDGQSLRQLLADTPLEPRRAAMVTHAIADACAAIHETGVAHGNLHPGTVLIGDEGRVVLADARVTDATSQEQDVRALGAILYSALTGHWPHEFEGAKLLPDALRVDGGKVASPRQIRAGVPADLDELCMRLLDDAADEKLPAAADVAAELSRFGPAPLDSLLGPDNPVRFPRVSPAAVRSRRIKARWGLALAGLLVLGLTASLVAIAWPSAKEEPVQPQAQATTPKTAPSTAPTVLKLTANQVRIVDPPNGARDELEGSEKTVDGKLETGWKSSWYSPPAEFGNIKKGMGLLINLGKPTNVSSVEVQFDAPGATVSLRGGTEDPGSTTEGDSKIATGYADIDGPKTNVPARVLFNGKEQVQYLLIWVTTLPSIPGGKYQIGVQEVTVRVT
ncbi:protein kinase family protein [Longispora albida]|uniref:protein kinase family protein n=1 Tax=Longispora albida TaxID=203523 RepID=UPI0003649459|nr:protein kinase family protein [Longispora albida]